MGNKVGGVLLGIQELKVVEKDDKIQLKTFTSAIEPNQVWFSSYLQWRTVHFSFHGRPIYMHGRPICGVTKWD